MLRQLRYLTWNDFDKAVNDIANYFHGVKLSGIYGVPRGGLCLAVALSHKMKLPLLDELKDNVLWVDDVVETGLTIKSYLHSDYELYFTSWFGKEVDVYYYSSEDIKENEWLVFPWENKSNAEKDMKKYELSRQ